MAAVLRAAESTQIEQQMTAEELLTYAPMELASRKGWSLSYVQAAQAAAAQGLHPKVVTVEELHRSRGTESATLPTSIRALDAALRGGLPVGCITELVGPAGSGKSHIALATCLAILARGLITEAVIGGGEGQEEKSLASVIFIDTEGKLSVPRFVAIAKAKLPEVFGEKEAIDSLMNRLLLLRPQSTEELVESLGSLSSVVRRQHVRLVVLDSVAALPRIDFAAGSTVPRQHAVGDIALQLKSLAERHRIPILVTNHVTANIGGHVGAELAQQAPPHVPSPYPRVPEYAGFHGQQSHQHVQKPQPPLTHSHVQPPPHPQVPPQPGQNYPQPPHPHATYGQYQASPPLAVAQHVLADDGEGYLRWWGELDGEKAALGTKWAHAVNVRLAVEGNARERRISVVKAPNVPRAAVWFQITENGAEDMGGLWEGDFLHP